MAEKEYKILRITPMVNIDAMGRFYKEYRVYFQYNEIEDWVSLKEEEFTEVNVRKAIEAKIAEIKKLLGK